MPYRPPKAELAFAVDHLLIQMTTPLQRKEHFSGLFMPRSFRRFVSSRGYLSGEQSTQRRSLTLPDGMLP